MLILLIHNNKVGHRINKWVAESTKWVTESTKWVTESTNGVITESTKWVWGTVSSCVSGQKQISQNPRVPDAPGPERIMSVTCEDLEVTNGSAGSS